MPELPFTQATAACAGMDSHEVIKEVLKKTSAKQIAAEIGLSLSLVYKWAEPPEEGSGANNPLDRIDQLLRATGDARIAQWVCERAGGFFIKNPPVGPRVLHLVPAMNQIVQEFADMLHVIAAAASGQHDHAYRIEGHPGALGRAEERDRGFCARSGGGRFQRAPCEEKLTRFDGGENTGYGGSFHAKETKEARVRVFTEDGAGQRRGGAADPYLFS